VHALCSRDETRLEGIVVACYAGELNRAGRVLETGRRSILFFSLPFLAPSARGEGDAWIARIRDQRVPLPALVLPSDVIDCHVNETYARSVMNFAMLLTHLHSVRVFSSQCGLSRREGRSSLMRDRSRIYN